jgi:signal transduction histidine kinase
METLQAPRSKYPRQRACHGAQVLVLEEDGATRAFLAHLLQESGYRVCLAQAVVEARQALEQNLPDLVLMGLPGLGLCPVLRARPGGEDIPVLVITQDESPQGTTQALKAGADDFLRMPLLAVELRARVRSLIRLRQLRRDLRQDRDAIRTLQGQKEELLQFVVHDLKNMLGTLLCSVELLEGGPAQAGLRGRQRVEDTARTMQGMVQSMLDLSVNEHAGLVPRPERIALEPWLEQVQLEFEGQTLRRGQLLRLSVEPGLDLEADPQLLQRVVLNLLENASKFSPAGSELGLTAYRVGPDIHLQVADQGDGIPAHLKERIFDRFVRLDQRAGVNAGRGLGLAFCRLVSDLHGGRIWVEDNGLRGSRFVIALPGRKAA